VRGDVDADLVEQGQPQPVMALSRCSTLAPSTSSQLASFM
jgi:hypothetical protein